MAEHCERKVSNFSRRIRYLFPLKTENLPTFSSASLRIFFTPILKYSDASCNGDEYDDDYDDEEDGESLSAYDAALIWMSNGMDEDYTFGYTEDELRDALR